MLNLEPITQQFIDQLTTQSRPPIYTLPYAEARQVLETLQSAPVSSPAVDIEDLDLPVGPKGKVSVRIYRPASTPGPLPIVIYLHGGGWILGSKHTHDRLVRDLTAASGLAFVSVNYTPSPEAQFPIPIEEAYAAAEYMAVHGHCLGLDASRIAIAGDSAGGCLAASVTLLSRRRNGPAFRQQVLFYPVTDAHLDTPTYCEFSAGPWLSRPAMQWFWDAYAPNPVDRAQSLAAPLQATPEELASLPPTLIIAAQNDVLRHEGAAYAFKLLAAGVPTVAVTYLGTIHDFVLINPLAPSPATRSAIELAATTLKSSLGEQ